MLTTDTGEFIEVSYYSNPIYYEAKEWYLSQVTGVNPGSIRSILNWDGSLTGVISPDGFSVYYTYQSKAYVVNYNPTVLTKANYKTTFEMMYKSFKAVSTVTTNTNLNTNTNINTNVNLNTNTNTNINANVNVNTNLNSNTNTS